MSRDALGRTDLPQYAHACEVLQNMIPLLSGGAYRRPGTLFQDYIPSNHAVPDPAGSVSLSESSPPRIFPFIVSQTQSYAIVIGTMRWAQSQTGGDNPVGNEGAGYLSYYEATGNNNSAFASDLVYGQLPYRCKSKSVAHTGTDQNCYTRQGGTGAVANSGTNAASTTVVDIADSLQTYDDDIWSVQYCQANDVMFLTHPDYPPQIIYLSAGTLFAVPYNTSLTGDAMGQSVPYLNQNSTTVTMAMSWSGSTPTAGGSGTLTASANFFETLHGPRAGIADGGSGGTDGAIIAIAVAEGSNWGVVGTPGGGIVFCQIQSISSATVANVVFLNGISQTSYSKNTPTPSWWESAWSNYRGWPSSCAIFQQRLCMASTAHQPNAMWFTAIGAFGVPASLLGANSCKFSALDDGPNQGIVASATGSLANGQNYSTPQNWVYFPVDDSQGDGQSTGPLGSQPFRISLATTSLDRIQYLSPDQQLFVGTATQEWIVAIENASFDVANSTATIQSHYGSDAIQAIRIGYEMMFVLQNKQEIRAYQYNYFDQSFFGEPVQLMFDEYPADEEGTSAVGQAFSPYSGRKKYRDMTWDASRSVLWCVDTAGNLFGLTRDRKLAITAWHTHQLGGFNAAHGGGQNIADNLTAGNYYTDAANFLCDGSVLSVCSTPNPLSGIRDIWLVVKRSIGNQTIYSVERMVGANTVRQTAYSPVAPGNAQEPLYVDCAYFLADNGNPANFNYTIGAQLSGVTITGTYYSQAYGLFTIGAQAAVASNGAIALQTNLPPDYGTDAVHTMVVGYPYSSVVQPVRPDPQSPIGTSQGAIKRVSKIYARLFKTLFFKAGTPPTTVLPANLEVVAWDQPASMAQSPEIFTGDKEVFLPTTYTREGYIYLVQDQPLPFTIISISQEGQEYEA